MAKKQKPEEKKFETLVEEFVEVSDSKQIVVSAFCPTGQRDPEHVKMSIGEYITTERYTGYSSGKPTFSPDWLPDIMQACELVYRKLEEMGL